MNSIYDIERKVFELDEIRIVIRTDKSRPFKDFNFTRKADGNTTVTEYVNNRIKPLLNDGIEIDIIEGSGQIPHPRTTIETVRNSYIK